MQLGLAGRCWLGLLYAMLDKWELQDGGVEKVGEGLQLLELKAESDDCWQELHISSNH